MNYFDLHCDTATKMYEKNLSPTSNQLHINFDTIKNFTHCYQLCAVFTDDTKITPGMEYFYAVVSNFSEKMREVANFTPLFSIEGGGIIQGDIDNLETLKNAGVKVFGFSWNGENELAAGNLYDPRRPLSPTGLAALGKMRELQMIPDISHLSDGGVFDIMNRWEGPFVATHSNCRAVCPHMRNCTDEQLSEIYRRKGLTGINLYPASVGEGPFLDALMKHVEHMLALGGEDCICMGCDWDGTTPPAEIKNLNGVYKIYEKITLAFSEQLAKKITFQNAYRFFFPE